MMMFSRSGKKLAQTVEKVRNQYPDAEVEVCAEDEHRVGFCTPLLLYWDYSRWSRFLPTLCKCSSRSRYPKRLDNTLV
ncbi:MAG: hypothetical protein HC851_02135 [Acaryochloris sp. RU_4_1]|nr:hypothetical protein [Acaryochloris sp. RU_4_1]NJR55680.1 hypothetical protein [Acaryochloris sp. CRU_2_0]